MNPEKLLEGLAKQFHAAHPNVTVDISPGAPTTDQLLPKLTAAFTSGTYPDISYNFGSWATQMQLSGRTLDITDKVKDPSVKWDEFPPAARQTATPNGHVIGFPAVVDNLALMYNKKLFQAAGLAAPTNTWTWDDFRAAAKKLTDPAKNVYGTAYSVSGTEDTTWHFWPLLWQKGGSVLNSDNSKAAFDSDAGVAALTFLQQMAVDRQVRVPLAGRPEVRRPVQVRADRHDHERAVAAVGQRRREPGLRRHLPALLRRRRATRRSPVRTCGPCTTTTTPTGPTGPTSSRSG